MGRKTEVTEFTTRSRASRLREEALVSQRAELDLQLGVIQRKVVEAETSRKGLTQAAARGGSWQLGYLPTVNQELKALRDTEETLEESIAELDGQVEAERAVPPNRGKIQGQLTALFESRLEQDGKIQEVVNQLRAVLSERAKLTARMAALAEQLEFAEDLDQQRFDELAAALPATLLVESERRTAALLGIPGDDFVPAVAREHLVLPQETLRHAGIVEPGEKFLLSPPDFDRLTRIDVHDPTNPYDTHAVCRQQCCCPDEFADDSALAENDGRSVGEVWRLKDAERQADVHRRAGVAARQQQIEDLAIAISWRTVPAMALEAARVLAEQQIEKGYNDPYRHYSQNEIDQAMGRTGVTV